MPRPKLMFVLGLATEKIGGMEKFLRYLSRAMNARGWDTLICFDGILSDRTRAYLAHPAVTLELVTGQRNLGTEGAAALRRLLAQHKPQVFLYAFHGVMRVYPWLARLAGVRRIFFNDHSSRPMGVVVTRMPLHKRMVGRALTFPLTGSISVCEFVKRCAATVGLSAAPNTVVWNGVETFAPQPERGVALRRQYGIPLYALVCTMSVWMVEVKGVDIMLRAAVELIRTDPRVWLLLIGDGPKLAEYRQLAHDLGIADRVVFPGLLSDPVNLGVFDATDISCQPSLWAEANPLAILEAMAMKIPVVASDIGGIPEIVKDNETGLLFPPADVDAMRAQLLRLTADPALRRSMGEAGYQRVMQHHRVEDVAARYADLLIG